MRLAARTDTAPQGPLLDQWLSEGGTSLLVALFRLLAKLLDADEGVGSERVDEAEQLRENLLDGRQEQRRNEAGQDAVRNIVRICAHHMAQSRSDCE